MNELERRLLESPAAPDLPEAVRRTLGLLRDQNASLQDLDEAIQLDPGLTTAVLELVNSEVYGLSRAVDSLREAVLVLGLDAVTCVALALALVRALRSDDDHGLRDEIWRTSLMTGLSARRLATETGGWEPEEAFLAGLIADCGALVLFETVEEYPALMERFREGEGDLLDLESSALETDHTKLGGLLLERWGFPKPIPDLIEAHHDPSPLPQGSLEELRARILTAAWLYSRALTTPGFAVEVASIDTHASTLLGLPMPVTTVIAAELPDEAREVAALLQLPEGRLRSYDEILCEANETLAGLVAAPEDDREEMVAAASAEMDRLRRELSGSISLDESTGLLSRPSFERMIEALHMRARQASAPVSLMVVEIDDLDEVHKFGGEQAVAQLMREVGARTTRHLRSSDQAARFAENQIAVLLPGCGNDPLTRAAERVRFEAEAEPIQTDGGLLECQVAIGLATATPHRDGIDARTLIRLASSAVERAQTSADRMVSAS
jgi:diguanylate cyclase (GGDEF)-like protein